MSQIVTQNSALSQNLVECTVHPPMAQPASTLRLVAAHAWLCSSARPAVSRAVRRKPCRQVAAKYSSSLRIVKPCRQARIAAPYTISWRFPRPCRACVTIQPSGQVAFLSQYNLLYRDTLPQQLGPRVRAARPCAWAGRVVAQLAVSWPLDGHILACHCVPLRVLSAVSLLLARPGYVCHDTTQCIVTQPPNGQ